MFDDYRPYQYVLWIMVVYVYELEYDYDSEYL